MVGVHIGLSSDIYDVSLQLGKKKNNIYSTEPNLLYKRGELMNKCRYRNKHLVSKLK